MAGEAIRSERRSGEREGSEPARKGIAPKYTGRPPAFAEPMNAAHLLPYP
jgi:hypothetical protein